MANINRELIIVIINFVTTLLLTLGLNNLQCNDIARKPFKCKGIYSYTKKNRKSYIYFGSAIFFYTISLNSREIAGNHIGGNDAIIMYNTFLRAKRYDFFDFWPDMSYRELGYSFITWIWSTHDYDYRIFLALQYVLSIVLLIIYLKHIKYKVKDLNAFLFLGLIVCYLVYEINLQRNCMAVFIALNIYNLLIEKKYKEACILIVLGAQIHLSIIVLMPLIVVMYVYNKKKISKRMILLAEVVCMTIMVVVIPVLLQIIPLFSQYQVYFINSYNGIRQPIVIILGTIILEKTNSVKKDNEGLVIVLYYAIIVFAFSLYISMAYRILFYFMPILFILFGAKRYRGIELFQLGNCIYMIYSKILLIYGYFMFYASYYKTGGVYNFFFR